MFVSRVLSAAFLLGVASAASHGGHPYHTHSVTVTGYLIDLECYFRNLRGEAALDGSWVITNPDEHKVVCLTMEVCRTYYIAANVGTAANPAYHPKFILDTQGNLDAYNMITQIDTLLQPDNVTVTVTGDHQGNGLLTNVTIKLCGDCEDACVGEAGDCNTMWTNDGSDVVMYSGHAIDLGKSSDGTVGLTGTNTNAALTGTLATEVQCNTMTTTCQSFTLADWDGTTYSTKYALDAWGNINTLALLKSDTVPSVTVFAKVMAGGILGAAAVQKCGTPADCGGKCWLGGSACTTSAPPMWMPDTKISGYLVDVYCHTEITAGRTTPDGSNPITAPWEHSVKCMTGPPQCNTYYIAANMGTEASPDYQPVVYLDTPGNRIAFDMMMASSKTNDYQVTAWGTNSTMNGMMTLQYISIQECASCPAYVDDSGNTGTSGATKHFFSSVVLSAIAALAKWRS